MGKGRRGKWLVAADQDEEFPEGRILTHLHKHRERKPALVIKKKSAVLRSTGQLSLLRTSNVFLPEVPTLRVV